MDFNQRLADLKVIFNAQRKAVARGDNLPEWAEEWLYMADLTIEELQNLQSLKTDYEKKERTITHMLDMLLTSIPMVNEESPLN